MTACGISASARAWPGVAVLGLALAAPAAAVSGRWFLVTMPSPPHSFGSSLGGVACLSARECIAVGDWFTTRAGDSRVLALAWNGKRWAGQPAPSRGRFAGLSGVSCPSARACTAVGSDVIDAQLDQRPLIERWNGRRWAVQRAPNPAGAINTFLASVSCPSPGDCFAAGGFVFAITSTDVLVEHWAGTRWTIQPVRGAPVGSNLNGIACSSASACTAVGLSGTGPLAARWNGTRWKIQQTPALPPGGNGALDSVSCPSAVSCVAVGTYTVGSSGPVTLAEHWDGARWTIDSVPNLAGLQGSDRDAVSCRSARSCILAGSATNVAGVGIRSLAEHWNSSRWSVETVPDPAGRFRGLLGVSCPRASACVAVGSYVRHGNVLGYAEVRR